MKILVENLSKLKKLIVPVIRLTWTNSNWHAWHLAVDENLDQVDLAASEYYSEGHLYRKDGLPIKMDSFYILGNMASNTFLSALAFGFFATIL